MIDVVTLWSGYILSMAVRVYRAVCSSESFCIFDVSHENVHRPDESTAAVFPVPGVPAGLYGGTPSGGRPGPVIFTTTVGLRESYPRNRIVSPI
jgi:hypothetical protein